MAVPSGDITMLLQAAQAGDSRAGERLIERIYGELREIASRLMRRERGDHSWSTTDLLHEGVQRMLKDEVIVEARGRGLLFKAANEAMRRLLVDHARQRAADKRGGKLRRTPLEDVFADFDRRGLDLLALDELLQVIRNSNPRQHDVIMERFFGGLEVADVAERLKISVSTVEAELRSARAWLKSKLSSESSSG